MERTTNMDDQIAYIRHTETVSQTELLKIEVKVK